MPVPIPVFQYGLRIQRHSHGFDGSVGLSTILSVTQMKLKQQYLHFFDPDWCSQFYFGVGGSISALFHHGHNFFRKTDLLISPEFTFGKQYTNEKNKPRFFQVELSWPTLSFKRA